MKIYEILNDQEAEELANEVDFIGELDEIKEFAIDGYQHYINEIRNEDEYVRLMRSGVVSDKIMYIADEIQKELDDEFASECDETFREAA